jgi:hypothetical protein
MHLGVFHDVKTWRHPLLSRLFHHFHPSLTCTTFLNVNTMSENNHHATHHKDQDVQQSIQLIPVGDGEPIVPSVQSSVAQTSKTSITNTPSPRPSWTRQRATTALIVLFFVVGTTIGPSPPVQDREAHTCQLYYSPLRTRYSTSALTVHSLRIAYSNNPK